MSIQWSLVEAYVRLVLGLFGAYNGIGNNIVNRYNQGDTVSVNFRLRYKTWDSAEGEKRSRFEVVLTDTPTTIRLGKISSAKRAEAEAKYQEAKAVK